jgi:hypothetical protein
MLMDTEPDRLRTMLTPKIDIQAVAPTAGSVLHRFIEAESLTINPYMEAGLAILLLPVEDLDPALVQHRVTTTTAHQIACASIPVNPRRYAYHTPTPGPGAA